MLRAFGRIGLDLPRILTEIGAAADLAEDPDLPITLDQFWGLWIAVLRESRDDCVGLRAAEATELKDYEVLGYLAATSTTAGQALERLDQYHRILGSTTRLVVDIQSEPPVIRHEIAGGHWAPRPVADFLLGALVVLMRRLVPRGPLLEKVHFGSSPPSDQARHDSLFQSPIEFDAGENALYLAFDLEQPLDSADPVLHGILERHAVSIGTNSQEADLLRGTRRLVAENLAGKIPDVEEFARRLGLSERTFRRKLSEVGTTFARVVSETQQELAIAYLSSNVLSIEEIAALLGFSEPSAFHRAIKRWTGRTPASLRKAGAPSLGHSY